MERKAQMQRSQKRPKLPPKPDTPEAVDGRKHIDVQTEQYLEELTDRPVEVDVDTQTDAFMDQLPAPIFIPMKTGVDVETQIYEVRSSSRGPRPGSTRTLFKARVRRGSLRVIERCDRVPTLRSIDPLFAVAGRPL